MPRKDTQTDSQVLPLSTEQVARAVALCAAANVVPCIVGPVGCGKTSIVRDFYQELKSREGRYRLHTVIGSRLNAEDIAGYPQIENDSLRFVLPEWLPLHPEDHTLLFIDEIDRVCDRAALNAIQSIISDRTVNNRPLSRHTVIVAACNAESESVQGYTVPLSDALATRVCWIYVDPHCPASEAAFQAWAARNNVHPLVRAFSRFSPADPLSDHGKDARDEVDHETSYAERAQRCRRTLDLCGAILAAADGVTFKTRDLVLPLFAGLVGRATAARLHSYVTEYDKCPALEQVIAAPRACAVPERPQFQYATALCVAGGVEREHARRALTYLARLDEEVGTYGARALALRFPDIVHEREWKPFNAASELVSPGEPPACEDLPLEATG